MSSIKFDTAVSGEEVRNLTVQWGYNPAVESRTLEQPETDLPASLVFRVLNPVFNFISMLAGAATALAILNCLYSYIKHVL